MTRLRGTYALAVAVVLLGLCPDLVLSTSFLPLSPLLMKDLGTSLTGLQVANGLSNAAFAIGAVVAAQLLQRYVQRPLFTAYVATFVVASICAAIAPSLPLFLVGRVVQGGTTGLMMISSLPPLVTRFGIRRLTWTVALVDVGLFGATTLGPVVGGFVAGSGSWRVLMWVVAAVGAAAVVAAVLGYPAFEPVDPSLPVDRPALVLTAVGPTLLFLATSTVSVTSWTWLFWVPFIAGLATIVALIAHERRREDPLMPVEELATQLPVTGTLVAMVAGAAFVTAVELVQVYLADVAHASPSLSARLFWTMPVAVIPAAALFGVLFRTRFVPYLVNVGLVALVAGGVVLLALTPSGATAPVPWAAALLGFGAGATVAPGLFLAGLGVRSTVLGRAFAMVQLLRLTATFAVGPVVLYLAQQQATTYDGVRLGVWITLALGVAGLVASLVIPALSGARPHAPDLVGWLESGERGMRSPATGVHVRPGVDDEEAEALLPSSWRRQRQ